jgi:hypothetical protein
MESDVGKGLKACAGWICRGLQMSGDREMERRRLGGFVGLEGWWSSWKRWLIAGLEGRWNNWERWLIAGLEGW